MSVATLIIIFGVVGFIRRRGIVHLSLSKFSFEPGSEDIVVIEGRKTGLMQWLLVQLKLGNIYRIHVKRDVMSYLAESASGKSLSLIPVHKIASTVCGYSKPIGYLILAALLLVAGPVFLISGNPSGGIICWIFAIISYGIYSCLKCFFITIGTEGNVRYGFSFRKALVENVSIDIEKIEAIIECINNLVIDINSGAGLRPPDNLEAGVPPNHIRTADAVHK